MLRRVHLGHRALVDDTAPDDLVRSSGRVGEGAGVTGAVPFGEEGGRGRESGGGEGEKIKYRRSNGEGSETHDSVHHYAVNILPLDHT